MAGLPPASGADHPLRLAPLAQASRREVMPGHALPFLLLLFATGHLPSRRRPVACPQIAGAGLQGTAPRTSGA